MSFIIYLLLIYSISSSYSEAGEKLIFVVTHFRHGARAPQNINSTYYDLLGEKWTNPGELTGMGQRMHYILGIRNRKRYIMTEKFLSEQFDPHEILIYSSSFNRTIISVSSQLQGLYPQTAEKGEILTKAQQELSYPQVDCNDSYIQEQINLLEDNALPYNMMLAPVRMINHNERKIIVFDIEGCTDEREEVKKKNRENLQILKDFVDKFNNKFGKTLNNFLGDSSKKYEMPDIDKICDAYISAYTDRRDLTEFKKTEINLTEFENICFEHNGLNYYYHYAGDEEKVLPHIETSKLMSEFIYYMKRRIDADINGEKVEEQFKDYSKPKMIMLSGHDSTLSAHEVFLIDALGLNYSYYRFPKFAAQMAFEVTRKENGPNKNYSDYTIHYIFNDEVIYNITVQDFIDKVEPHIWTSQQINDFCGFDENEDFNKINNSSNSYAETKKNDNAKKAYKVLMIIFIILSAILLATTIFLALKLSKKTIPPMANMPNITNSFDKM